MRTVIYILAFFPLILLAQPQTGARVALSMLERAASVEGSRAGQIPLSNADGNLRYAQYVEVNIPQLGYTPTATGNTQNLSEFVKGQDGNTYYIDWQGRAILLAANGLLLFGPFADQDAAGAGGVTSGQLFYIGYNSTVYQQGMVVRKN